MHLVVCDTSDKKSEQRRIASGVQAWRASGVPWAAAPVVTITPIPISKSAAGKAGPRTRCKLRSILLLLRFRAGPKPPRSVWSRKRKLAFRRPERALLRPVDHVSNAPYRASYPRHLGRLIRQLPARPSLTRGYDCAAGMGLSWPIPTGLV